MSRHRRGACRSLLIMMRTCEIVPYSSTGNILPVTTGAEGIEAILRDGGIDVLRAAALESVWQSLFRDQSSAFSVQVSAQPSDGLRPTEPYPDTMDRFSLDQTGCISWPVEQEPN